MWTLVFQDKVPGEHLPNAKSSVMSKCLLNFEGSEFVSIYYGMPPRPLSVVVATRNLLASSPWLRLSYEA